MSAKRVGKGKASGAASQRLVDLLQAKYHEDPEGFRRYLPAVAEYLPEPPRVRSITHSPFGLTENELAYHRAGLQDVLAKLHAGTVTPREAAKGLQHCANLISDDNLADEVDYEVLRSLVRAAIGRTPGSYKSKTIVPLGEGKVGTVLEQVSTIRGVYLDLDREGRLVSVSIHPGRVGERRALMEFVGASADPQPDVASRHDDYLAGQDPHGTT